jgi:beta-lactamase superfamily II metal-dependent hydrolase
LWGDYVKLLNGSSANYQEVHVRDADGWVDKKLLQKERILEVNFIDVGQGDGCFIVLPDKNDPLKDKFVLVDAGIGQNMAHFLNWRFNFKGNTYNLPIEYLIITHADADHFLGFKEIINNKRCLIEKIYHNGIVPRAGKDKFGKTTSFNGKKYLQEVVDDRSKLEALIKVPENLVKNDFLNMMKDALASYKKKDFIEMLEYGMKIPGYSSGEITFEVLGPITVNRASTKLLPTFGGDGPTKNGNSIVLKLTYKNLKILLPGDVNKKSQEYLTEFYLQKAGIKRSKTDRGYIKHLNVLKGIFESDVTKSNHHGSSDFLFEFFQFINPIATVISSGDNETFTHPRPDTLGVIGKTSRGEYPLIFSTELARSSNDNMYNDSIKNGILKLEEELKDEKDLKKHQNINKKITTLISKLQRNIAVYGMITLRSDGEKAIIAQKKEKKGAGFQIYKLTPNKNGELAYTDK